MIAVLCSVSPLTFAALSNLSGRDEHEPKWSVDQVAGALLADGTGTSHCEECGSSLDAEGKCTNKAMHE
jgi:hypothetical protein